MVARIIGLALLILALSTGSSSAARGNSGVASVQGAGEPDCAHYQFQEDAQLAMDMNPWLQGLLDLDRDGIACNALPTRAEVLPVELHESEMLEMGYMSHTPVVSFGFDYKAYLGGFVPQRNVGKVAGVVCPDLASADVFQVLVPSGSIVFLQDQFGAKPEKDPEATAFNPTWLSGALLWVWDGESDPVNVNEWLLRNGYGVYSGEAIDSEWSERLQAAGRLAQDQGNGVWGECSTPNAPMLNSFEPTHEQPEPTIVTSISGDWSKSANFTIPQDGSYEIAVRCPGPSCYVEVKTLRHLATGQEFPQVYSLIFGPNQVFTELYLPAGDYLVQIEGVGGWFFSVDALDQD